MIFTYFTAKKALRYAIDTIPYFTPMTESLLRSLKELEIAVCSFYVEQTDPHHSTVEIFHTLRLCETQKLSY